jgi:hypothetical protein
MRRCWGQFRGRHDHAALPRVKGAQFLLQVLILLAWICGGETRLLYAQSPFVANSAAESIDPCTDPSTHSAIKDAFRLVCSRAGVPVANRTAHKVLVIGFLGGFVKRNDVKHPEVLFANYLRRRYDPVVRAAVFGNHEVERALEFVRIGSEKDNNGAPASTEKQPAKIILYGHSWGASQVLEFARELERRQISVALTIQIDSVHKIRQDDRTVPANVAKAVNFYQRKGLTPGQPHIIPENAERTKILGNFHMTYKGNGVRCDNYRWLSRALNKPHHQIENDPHIWDQIVILIDSELSGPDNVEKTQSASRARTFHETDTSAKDTAQEVTIGSFMRHPTDQR